MAIITCTHTKKRTVSAKKHHRLRNLCRTDYYLSFSSTPLSSSLLMQLLGTSKQPTKRIDIYTYNSIRLYVYVCVSGEDNHNNNDNNKK